MQPDHIKSIKHTRWMGKCTGAMESPELTGPIFFMLSFRVFSYIPEITDNANDCLTGNWNLNGYRVSIFFMLCSGFLSYIPEIIDMQTFALLESLLYNGKAGINKFLKTGMTWGSRQKCGRGR